MAKNTNKKAIEIPKLPYGEGTISWMPDGETLIYKKTINKKRISVYGTTVKEVMTGMRVKEKEVTEKIKSQGEVDNTELFSSSIQRWLNTYKKAELKARSYDRTEHTMNNQILKYDIANLQVQGIKSDNIQNHINTLVSENYSYSTIKKTYELLNQYFNYLYVRDPINNPMLTTKKPTKNAMNVVEKTLDIFDDEDIRVFTKEATREYKNGKPCYRQGWGLVFLMYTGLRINEATALRWGNFEEEHFKVYENLARVIDRDKGDNGKKKNGTYFYKTIYTSTKTPAGYRKVYLNNKSKEAYFKIKEIQNPKNDDGFIFATKSGKADTDRNLRRALNNIQERAGTKAQNSGLHLLRRTYVSLLVRSGVDKKIIADNIGQEDTDMIEKIYYQLTEKEIIKPVKVINDMSKLIL